LVLYHLKRACLPPHLFHCGLQDKLKVALHEVMVRRFTNIFDQVEKPFELRDELRDADGNFVFILPDIDYLTLRSLSELIYTGATCLTSEECKRELLTLLPQAVRLATSETATPIETDDGSNLKANAHAPLQPAVEISEVKDVDPSNKPHSFIDNFTYAAKESGDGGSADDGDYDEYPFVCKECGYGCTTKYRYDNHLRSHTGEKPFCCCYCAKNFSSANILQRHQKTIHPDEYRENIQHNERSKQEIISARLVGDFDNSTRAFPCQLCEKEYDTKRKLKEHERVKHTHGGGDDAVDDAKEGARFGDSSEADEDKPLRKRLHPCSECNLVCFSPSHLGKHMRKHTGELPYTCKVCSKGFSLKSNMERHLRSHEKPDKKPIRLLKLKKQVRLRREGEPPPPKKTKEVLENDEEGLDCTSNKRQPGVRGGCCNFCNKFYDSKTQLKIHERTHTGERPFVCQVCQKAFTSKNNLKMHLEAHSSEKPFVCDTCGQAFGRKAYLRAHNKQVHNVGNPANYSCQLCNIKFVTLMGYDKHMKIHMEEDPYCELCNKKFKTKKKLYAHKTYVHSTEASYQCATCGSKFKTKTYLKYHEYFHLPESERPFPCDQCDKRFALKKQLMDHQMSVHSTEEKFQCDKCPYKTKIKECLKRHINRKHFESGLKPIKCSYCDNRFITKKEKNEHERTHTGEKPFECDICHQRFGRTKTLKEHRYTHTGEKPQSCRYCDYRCIQRNDMKKHEKRHADKMLPSVVELTVPKAGSG